MVDTFTFVHIPQDDSLSVSLIEKSVSGGLEQDELQVYAKKVLSTPYDGHAA